MESSLKRRDPMHHQPHEQLQHQHQQQPPRPLSPQSDSDAESGITTITTTVGDRLVSPCKRLRLDDIDSPDKKPPIASSSSEPAHSSGMAALVDQTNQQGITFLDNSLLRGFRGSLEDPANHDPSLADMTQGGEEGSRTHGVTFLDQTNTKALHYHGGDRFEAVAHGAASSSSSRSRSNSNSSEDTTSTVKCTYTSHVPTPQKVSSPSANGFQATSGFLTGLPLARDGSGTSIRYAFHPVVRDSGTSIPAKPEEEEEKKNAPASASNKAGQHLVSSDREQAFPNTREEQSSCPGGGAENNGQACSGDGTDSNDRPETPSDDEEELDFPGTNANDASLGGGRHPNASHAPPTPQHRIPNNTPEKAMVTDNDEDDDSDVGDGFDGIIINRILPHEFEQRVLSPILDDSVRSADGAIVERLNEEAHIRTGVATSQGKAQACTLDYERSVPCAGQTNPSGALRQTEAIYLNEPTRSDPHGTAKQIKHLASHPLRPQPSGEGFYHNRPTSQSDGSLKPQKDFTHPHIQSEAFHQPQRDLHHPRSKGFEHAQSEGIFHPIRELGHPKNENFYFPMYRARSNTVDHPLPAGSQLQQKPQLRTQLSSGALARQENVAHRLRFSSANNLLCPEELDHHMLSLQSYGGLAPFGNPGLQRQRAVSSGSFLDIQDDRFHRPSFPPATGQLNDNHRRHLSASSASQENVFRPQNLDQRFSQALELEGRDGEGSGAAAVSRGRLMQYGSVDASSRHQMRESAGGLVNYGSVDGPLGGGALPLAEARLNEQRPPGDSNQARLWFYGSVDDPQRVVRSQSSVQQADSAGQQAFQSSRHRFSGRFERQGSLAQRGSEQAFVRSASRRTLPILRGSGSQGRGGQLGHPGSHDDNGTKPDTFGHLGSHDSEPYQGHVPGADTANYHKALQQGHLHHGILSQPGHDHYGMRVHFEHPFSGASSGTQGGGGGVVGGGLGSFDHYDFPADYHHQHHQQQLTHSSSQGSMDSQGRSAGSQRSADSQGRRSVRSQHSADSQDRQRSCNGSQRSGGSQDGRATTKSSGSQESQGSVDGGHWRSSAGGQRGEKHRAEEAFPAITEAELKRKVLETAGQLLVAVYMNCGLVTVHVIEGRSLTCTWKPVCDAYIKLSLIPEEGGRKLRLKSKPVLNTSNPVFDEKFSLEMQKSDENKRLLVSVWHKDLNSGCSEFLGCMSFGVKGILRNKEVNGWYYLLTEDVGKKKHLEVTSRPKPALRVRGHNIPPINRDVLGLDTVSMKLERGKNGFGFTVVDEFPVKVGRVDLASPAEGAGLKPGDYIIKVNNQNVSRSTVNSVAKLVKKSGDTLLLIVHRPQSAPEPSKPTGPPQPVEPTVWKRPEPIYEIIPEEMTHDGMVIVDSSNKENEISRNIHLEMSSVYQPFIQGKLSASTPLPGRGVKLEGSATDVVETDDQKKSEAIHRLLSLELDFIDFMQLGIKRYCRPLKHCIFSAAQHSAVFQNVEKLVNISEYHVQQIQENSPPMYPESDDDSQSSEDKHFASAVAMIYYSKAHMFCQAHESYAEGLSEANRVLSDMRQNEEFLRFIKDPPLDPGQPSISAFIFRPLQHIKELSAVFQEIFAITPKTSTDYSTLKQVTQVLQESVVNISNMSNARVQSLTSLTSHTKSSSSGKGSCAASSVASSRADSGSESGRTRKKENMKPSASMQTVRPPDREVLQVQDKLVFSDNVPVFQLCQEDRHIIYQGELFYMQNNNWSKIQMVLFSDMVLLCRPDKDGSLHVLHDPVLLHEVCQLESSNKHSTELVLRICPTSPCTGIPTTQCLTFRTPTPQDLSTWKNLLEQRIKTAQGNATFGNPSLSDEPLPTPGFVH